MSELQQKYADALAAQKAAQQRYDEIKARYDQLNANTPWYTFTTRGDDYKKALIDTIAANNTVKQAEKAIQLDVAQQVAQQLSNGIDGKVSANDVWQSKRDWIYDVPHEEMMRRLTGETVPSNTTATQGTTGSTNTTANPIVSGVLGIANLARALAGYSEEADTGEAGTKGKSSGSKTSEKETSTSTKSEPVTTTPVPTQVRTQVTPATGQATVAQPIQFGATQWHIPADGYTHQNDISNISIDPIGVYGDNGGSQHAALNALYRNPHAAPSLGEVLAFSSILNGKTKLGGLDDVTTAMSNADKMNAYAAQGVVGEEMQRLIAQGRTIDEARAEAVSNYLLRSGQARSAVSTALPEYQKSADDAAQRAIDLAISTGGSYSSRGMNGYNPYGISSITANSDGTYNIDANGATTTNIPYEYAGYGVYGAIKGGGVGAKTSADQQIASEKSQWDREKAILDAEANLRKTALEIETKLNRNIPLDAYEKAYLQRLGIERAKIDAVGGAGNTTGFKPVVGY